MMTTFAFALRSDPERKVRFWCERLTGQRYLVLNGGFEFILSKGRTAKIEDRIEAPEVELVWSGKVPKPHGSHYNDAIAWIQAQLDAEKEFQ